jgi:monoamine oxidase
MGRKMRVCVIGAGFAGLAAADELRRNGHTVVVLEARERVGGRVWSERLPNGAVIERGAEFIEHYHEEVARVVSRLGLSFAPTSMAYGDREPRGNGIDRTTYAIAWLEVMQHLAQREPDASVSITDLLETVPISSSAREAIVARIEISATHPADDLAADTLGKGGYAFSSDESLRIAGGNQQIALAFADLLGDAVHLSTPVERVVWSGDGIRVMSGDRMFDADSAIISVPARVIDQVAFDPPLPERKRAALANVSYGHAAKLFVPLTAPAPTSAILSVPDRFWCWTATNEEREVQPVVSCFAGSTPALERLGVTEGSATWLERLSVLRPDLSLDADGATLTNWDADPWIGASYSIVRPGNPIDVAALTEPVGPLFFAGEHTAGGWRSTMEGALRSGRNAAEATDRGFQTTVQPS